MRRVLFALGLVACGSVASTGSSSPDAAAPTADASPAVAPDASEAATPNFTPVSCDGGAVDAAACDPSRLRVVHRGSGDACFALGQFCDTLSVSVQKPGDEKLPAGFTCGYELGVAYCSWPLVNHTVDQAALDAACAATQALPGVDVECIIYD